MKVGDLVKFIGQWAKPFPHHPEVGVVMGVWFNGRTRKISSAEVMWDNGNLGNVLAGTLEVIDG